MPSGLDGHAYSCSDIWWNSGIVEIGCLYFLYFVTKVSNGSLLIFPAYLQHSVDPNMNGEERISVSFNLMFSMFAENLSKPLW